MFTRITRETMQRHDGSPPDVASCRCAKLLAISKQHAKDCAAENVQFIVFYLYFVDI